MPQTMVARKFSRRVVWLAGESQYGDRLLQITIERILLTRVVSDLRLSLDNQELEAKLHLISALDAERDSILSIFQEGEMT